MESFLTSIAKAYSAQYSDLSSFLFVFPGRRAGTFFIKYLAESTRGRDILLPDVTTMSDFVEKISGKVVAGRIELLFILYQAYSGLLRDAGAEKIPDFDAFRRWGETALSDFNEVDMQCVDPDAIFKNVKDIKEISSNFLTEEQMKVMNEFFGQAFDPENIATEFWKKFTDKEDSELHSKFRLLWQVLAPLYAKFKEHLDAMGLTTSGGSYRIAADILEKGFPRNVKAEKVVMVGFNALTSSERKIFDALSNLEDESSGEPFADFFWDAPGPVILDRFSTAGRYVQHGIDRWPAPQWALPYLAESDVEVMPKDIRVISVPSNSAQTKVVSEVLADMTSRLPESDFTSAKVAVVLPDEGLLMPMLYSLPAGIKDVNLTMGYPLRLSAVYTFVSLLRRLESSRRKSGNGIGYYYKDFNMLLSHPFSRVLFGQAVTDVKEWIMKHHRFIIDVGDIRDISPDMANLLRPLNDDAGPEETFEWLDLILSRIASATDRDETKTIKDNVDASNIAVYRLALRKMLEAVEEYGISMQWRTFLTLTDRLISSETVNFEGQPLKGLQVMGILETRALDFERIIIPSLNERILPARRRTRTFISDSLRKAYGLPPVNYSESLFAYYFYRMIARAKEVVLLYDSRSSEGVRSGDVSRYVLQLRYLYARENLRMESRSFRMSKSELKPSPIAKTPQMLEGLSTFLDPGPEGSNLSATALTKYTGCQLRFYYENILKIKTDEESGEYIDSITQGSIVHDVMQRMYLPDHLQKKFLENPQVIDTALINSRIKDANRIDDMIKKAINRLFFHLPADQEDRPLRGSSAHVAKILRNQVIGILKFDLSQAPFLLFGVEMDGNVSLRMPDGRLVNMRYAIDRLDTQLVTHDGVERELLRIVDYKTGTVHAEAETMESVFMGDYKGKNLLQLWLYANLFDALPDKNFDKNGPRPILDLFGQKPGFPTQPLILELYDISYISSGRHVYPKVEGEFQQDHTQKNAEYLSLLENTLEELFDPSSPFRPAADEEACRYCPFKTICWR
ncbi:MAG: PD-(D/E)XK nuclease family protein [Muribaculum sp.]|nr:PD-(D/E)XK nuclease family protein [Muribaculum sp.]